MPAGRYPGRMHTYRDSQIPKLLAAHEAGQFVRVSCRACKVTRFYLPADIEKVFGNLNVFELDGRFRCEKCGTKEDVSVAFANLVAGERPGMTIRKLERIEMRRVPVWRDVKL